MLMLANLAICLFTEGWSSYNYNFVAFLLVKEVDHLMVDCELANLCLSKGHFRTSVCYFVLIKPIDLMSSFCCPWGFYTADWVL